VSFTHQPRKRFGQNFLHDGAVIDRIVNTINPQKSDFVVEIGPGQGALTFPLLKRLDVLTAVELDRDLIAQLQLRAADVGQLNLVSADALQVDFTALADSQKIRLVGNLPYNISSPLLFHALDHVDVIRDMHFMLQWEVVERMAAAPGGKTYGRLSVMVQARARVESMFKVLPESFYPVPKVESAIVRIVPHDAQIDAKLLSGLERVVRAAFAQRRKTLSNALKGVLTAVELTALGVDPTARAETISVAAFLRLAQAIS
jgi:16S rRNA (adenine1518-N6/adenine1519-N6)-dimethyltransferase